MLDRSNLFLYAAATPINLSDPSGYGPYSFEFGDSAEIQIRARYGQGHPKQQILYGERTGLGRNPRLMPDIFNMTLYEWMEIKPLSIYGVVTGIAQRQAYIKNFAPLGYRANTTWIPRTQPLIVMGTEIYVFNIGGILFYTDFSAKDLLVLPFLWGESNSISNAFTTQVVRQIQAIRTKAVITAASKRAALGARAGAVTEDEEVGVDALEEVA